MNRFSHTEVPSVTLGRWSPFQGHRCKALYQGHRYGVLYHDHLWNQLSSLATVAMSLPDLNGPAS